MSIQDKDINLYPIFKNIEKKKLPEVVITELSTVEQTLAENNTELIDLTIEKISSEDETTESNENPIKEQQSEISEMLESF